MLREHEAGAEAAELCRKYGMSEATLYNWKAKFGGMDVSDAKRLRALEDENGKLKKLLAESMLNASALRELLGKNGRARRKARGCRSSADDVPDERASGGPAPSSPPIGPASGINSAGRLIPSSGAGCAILSSSAARLLLTPRRKAHQLPRL